MAHANGIHADFLQFFKSVLPHFVWYCGTEYTSIVVQADALHLHPLVIQGKAMIRVKGQCAKTGTDKAFVEEFGSLGVWEFRRQPCLYII